VSHLNFDQKLTHKKYNYQLSTVETQLFSRHTVKASVVVSTRKKHLCFEFEMNFCNRREKWEQFVIRQSWKNQSLEKFYNECFCFWAFITK
jgi:hypothetical protein